MRSTFVLLLLVLPRFALGGEPERRPAEYLIGAYYYPWYYKERWTREPVTNTPKLGWYSSSDGKVAADHIRWAKQADLDFFLVSWLSPDGLEGKNLHGSVLPELAEARFRFALLYETPLALGLPAGKPLDLAGKLADGVNAGDRLVEHFDYLAETYLKHPQYLRFDGKAVVVIYLVRDLVNAGQYLKAMRERLARRGIDLYLIADAVYWEAPDKLDWAFLKEHFQAVTAYNMYYRPKFLEAVRGQFEATDRAARAQGLRLIPNVMPGYDDSPLRGTERVTINRRHGQFYRDYWGVASKFVGPDQPFLFVTSFNEWHEGTELEPSTEYGDMYLRLTRELAGGLRKR
jgi:glycoprotein endo-alpha-1,2-mannosidase